MGPEFSKTIDLETAGGVIDRDTIKWWLKQSREAQSAIMTDEIPLDDALLQLREFIDENSGEFFVQVWGNGANFDNTILRRSYERQGIPCPWRYYNDRDVRTIVELGKAIDFDARTAIPFEGERHNALDDARYQAKYVSVIWQKLIPNQADFLMFNPGRCPPAIVAATMISERRSWQDLFCSLSGQKRNSVNRSQLRVR